LFTFFFFTLFTPPKKNKKRIRVINKRVLTWAEQKNKSAKLNSIRRFYLTLQKNQITLWIKK